MQAGQIRWFQDVLCIGFIDRSVLDSSTGGKFVVCIPSQSYIQKGCKNSSRDRMIRTQASKSLVLHKIRKRYKQSNVIKGGRPADKELRMNAEILLVEIMQKRCG